VGHAKEMMFPFGDGGAWGHFANEIEKSGFTIATNEKSPDVNYLIAHSHSRQAIREANENGVPLKNRILVIWEPSVVNEKLRHPRTLKHYGHVFVPSAGWIAREDFIPFKWPQSVSGFLEVDFSDWVRRENTSVVIQANKFSIHKNEKYSLRRKSIRTLQDLGFEVALFGSDWDKGSIHNLRSWLSSARYVSLKNWRLKTLGSQVNNHSGYRGVVENKQFASAQYRCAIVIENSLDYVSEKLFDAVSSGAYVIYVGPDLSKFGLVDFVLKSIHPSEFEIACSVVDFLRLEPEKQFEIMKTQRDSLLKYLNEHDNTFVLRNLAKECLEKFTV
jgi:hypothetical protein